MSNKITPKSTQEITGIEAWDLTASELHQLEFIAGLDAQLQAGQRILRDRLRSVNAWRDFRIAVTACERALDKCYNTVPVKTLRHMLKMSECGEIIFRPKPAVRQQGVQLIMDEDLKVLVNQVVENVCAICVCDSGHQRSCKLRHALKEIAPSNLPGDKYHCPYRDVAAQCEMGAYIE